MGDIVVSNAFLLNRATALRTALNAGHWLYLFTNNFTPSPASTLLHFTEATFPGYAPLTLADLFAAPLKVRDGEYVLTLPNQIWTATAGSDEIIYGWYIRKAAVVQFSARLPIPIPVLVAGDLEIGLAIQEVDLSVLE